MVVHDFDVLRPGLPPAEDDPPLIVDADCVLSAELAPQLFKTVAWRDGQIVEACGGVQLHQFPAGDLGEICIEAFRRAPLDKDQSGEVAAEALDHGVTYHSMIRRSIDPPGVLITRPSAATRAAADRAQWAALALAQG